MLKNVILPAILALSCYQLAHAQVVELDNLNTNHCRKQLITGDPAPIVFIYITDCPWAKKLRPIYEEVSNEYPNRNFFAFNFYDHNNQDNSVLMMQTAMECLGTKPFISPILVEYNVFSTTNPNKYYGQINGIEKMGLDGAATKQDIIKFIDEAQNQHSSTLLKDTTKE